MYTDEACTDEADIAEYDPDTPGVPGDPVAGSRVEVGQDSMVPLFWFPDGVDVLWGKTHGGHKLRLTADVDVRLDRAGATWVNVRGFGAAGDGETDDTAAIQAAIDSLPTEGGTVYVPAGTYLISDAITLRNQLVVLGDGDKPSVIMQVATNKDALTGTSLDRITMQGLYLMGTGAGSGTGIRLLRGVHDNVAYICLRDLTVDSFGQDGVSIENAIVSSFDRVVCQSNGRYGIHLWGQTGGAAGTSCSLTACYGNANGTAGYRIFNMVYVALNGCAADHDPVGYLIDSCQSVTVNGSGAEGCTTAGVQITGGYGITLAGQWFYDNRGLGIHVTGTAKTVSLIGCTDNTPNVLATNFIKVDTGCQVTLMGCNNTTANSLASGTTNVASDAAGGAQFQGYTALLNGGEFDNDLTCYVASKGIVLTDRSNGNRYRLLVSGGALSVEAV